MSRPGKAKVNRNLRLITVYLPENYIERLDELVFEGLYPSRNEAIRIAVRDFLNKEYRRRRRVKSKLMVGL